MSPGFIYLDFSAPPPATTTPPPSPELGVINCVPPSIIAFLARTTRGRNIYQWYGLLACWQCESYQCRLSLGARHPFVINFPPKFIPSSASQRYLWEGRNIITDMAGYAW